MIKVVSYALFEHPSGGSWKSDGTPGKLDGYIRYLPAIIRAHHVLWPGWSMFLHHDRAVAAHRYYPALERMQEQRLITLRPCGDAIDVGSASLWRFKPAMFKGDWIVLSHDIDSFPTWTMRRCAEEFVASKASACVVHGCESHNTAMAGLFMLRSDRFRELVADNFPSLMQLGVGRSFDWYGADEHYLRDTIWPRLEREAMLIRLGGDTPSLIKAPDVRTMLLAWPDDVPTKVATHSYMFAPYPGAAGFDTQRAMDWFDTLADEYPALQAIDDCEQTIATGREISRL